MTYVGWQSPGPLLILQSLTSAPFLQLQPDSLSIDFIIGHVVIERQQSRSKNAPCDLLTLNQSRSRIIEPGDVDFVVTVCHLQLVTATCGCLFEDPAHAPIAVDDAISIIRVLKSLERNKSSRFSDEPFELGLQLSIANVGLQIVGAEFAFQFDKCLRARGAENLGFFGIGPDERPFAVVRSANWHRADWAEEIGI